MTRDIFVLAKNPALYNQCTDAIVEHIHEKYGNSVDAIVTPDAKGFLFGPNVASKLNVLFIPIRKAGKLLAYPDDLIQATYQNRMNKVKCSRKIHPLVVQRFILICTLLLIIILLAILILENKKYFRL